MIQMRLRNHTHPFGIGYEHSKCCHGRTKKTSRQGRIIGYGSTLQKILTHELGLHGHGLSEQDLVNGAIVEDENVVYDLNHGDVVIAAITSCTNTSNPGVMLAAGLLARKCETQRIDG